MSNKKHKRPWSQGDVALLKTLLSQGKSTKQIATVMKRSIPAIHSRKCVLGLNMAEKKTKTLMKGKVEVMKPTTKNSLREEAKDLTSVARTIARKNGKRVTMAMFFIEDF